MAAALPPLAEDGSVKRPRTPQERRLARLCRIADAVISTVARLEVHDRGPLAAVGPFLGGANHRSLADLFVGMAAFHRMNVQPRILFKKSFLPGPLARLATFAGVIVVTGKGATEAGVNALNDGASLMIMIEGGLFYDKDEPTSLGPPRKGIARMSRLTARPMIPIAVEGTEVLWPKGSFPRLNPFRRKNVVVRIGDPMVSTDEDDQLGADQLRDSISELLAG